MFLFTKNKHIVKVNERVKGGDNMMHNLADLREKEAINILDGRCLGAIVDAVINLQEGQVVGVLLPGGFFNKKNFLREKPKVLVGVVVGGGYL